MTDLDYVKKIDELEAREKNIEDKKAINQKKQEEEKIAEQIRSSMRQGL